MQNQQKKKSEDLGLKLGSDDMVFWQKIIEAKKIDVENTETNLKYYKWLLEKAEEEYKMAEAAFNEK